jgi:hypothetical protein
MILRFMGADDVWELIFMYVVQNLTNTRLFAFGYLNTILPNQYLWNCLLMVGFYEPIGSL